MMKPQIVYETSSITPCCEVKKKTFHDTYGSRECWAKIEKFVCEKQKYQSLLKLFSEPQNLEVPLRFLQYILEVRLFPHLTTKFTQCHYYSQLCRNWKKIFCNDAPKMIL